MSRVAIDIRSIFGQRTGKGEHTLQILKHLLKIDPFNQYYLYSNTSTPLPFSSLKNIHLKVIKHQGLLFHLYVWLDLKLSLKPDYYFAPSSYLVPALGVKNTILLVPDLVAFLFPSKHNLKAVFLEKISLRLALRKSRFILAISESTKNDLIRIFRLPPSKIIVVYLGASEPLGLSLSDIARVKAKFNLPDRFILTVGTLEPRKNLVRLIEAYARLSLSSCPLVIVGKKGWHYQEIFNKVSSLKLTKKVLFLGYLPRKELAALYQAATCFIYPSLYEGFGLPPLEAMVYGAPVIVSNLSSLPEVVGKAAILINPLKTGEIANSLHSLLADQTLRNKLARLGFKQAKKFNWETTAREILSLIN